APTPHHGGHPPPLHKNKTLFRPGRPPQREPQLRRAGAAQRRQGRSHQATAPARQGQGAGVTMTKPSTPPAVTTFADHDVIVPPNPLKKAVVRANPGEAQPDPVVRAEQALSDFPGAFSRWREGGCQRLDAGRHAVAAGFTDKTLDELFRAAHDIKGEAATFGSPLIEPVAASLCRPIEHSPDLSRI